jgi:hypothetical protein
MLLTQRRKRSGFAPRPKAIQACALIYDKVMEEYKACTEEELKAFSVQGEVLQSIAARGMQRGVSHFKETWNELSETKKGKPRVYAYFVNYFKGMITYHAVEMNYTRLHHLKREHTTTKHFIKDVLKMTYQRAHEHICLFLLGWNKVEFQYFRSFSLLEYAPKLCAWFTQFRLELFNQHPEVMPPPIVAPSGHQVEVRASRVHGFGLFATRDIKAGEDITPVQGVRLSDEEFERLYPKGKRTANILTTDTDQKWEITGLARYANNPPPGMQANCVFVDTERRKARLGQPPVALVASADIVKNQEILADYKL